MDGSRLALVENGELLSVAQFHSDMMKAGRKMSLGQRPLSSLSSAFSWAAMSCHIFLRVSQLQTDNQASSGKMENTQVRPRPPVNGKDAEATDAQWIQGAGWSGGGGLWGWPWQLLLLLQVSGKERQGEGCRWLRGDTYYWGFLSFLKEGLKWDQGTCILKMEKQERKVMNAYCPAWPCPSRDWMMK